MVPADEVEELVARREQHLPQPLVRLDAGREPDLVSIGKVPASAAPVVTEERTARAERAHLGGKAFERALDEERSGCDVEVRLRSPELLAEATELGRSKGALGEGED